MKTKKEMVNYVLRHAGFDGQRLRVATIKVMCKKKQQEIFDVYTFAIFHPEHIQFCAKKLLQDDVRVK